MINAIRKRNGEVVKYNIEKIARAIFKAAKTVGGKDYNLAMKLAKDVEARLETTYKNNIPEVEEIQDAVEKVLIEGGYAKTSKAYILYREQRKSAREKNAFIGATESMFNDYLGDGDWAIKENAGTQRSIAGLEHYIRNKFTSAYWSNSLYPDYIKKAHEDGDCHIHDLGFYGAYCVGWDLQLLLLEGLYQGPSKTRSKPAKHFSVALRHIVNATFLGQSETAGAQAWSSFDTYMAPFVRKDNLSYEEVYRLIENFVFELNMSTRVGGQSPFSNLTFDITIPNTLKDKAAIVGGQPQIETYGDYQKEVNMINKAFCQVMYEGDAEGQVFTFPIPTLNITKEFDWDNEVMLEWMKITAKYGIPYFSNYVNSDLSPEDALSMCCRLRLDTSELRKRGGGLFGSNPLTGSIGVFTINLSRIGYLANDFNDYKGRLLKIAELGKEQLEIKRARIEDESNKGLYPYCAFYLDGVKQREGEYWANHFSTIGLVGMNESILNLIGEDITTPKGQKVANEIMDYLREIVVKFQEETSHYYNLEATPAEGASYRLAQTDLAKYPDIITAGLEEHYYTNSSQLPVGYTDDIFKTLDLQDELQSKYTGGTVLHLYLGEAIDNPILVKTLIQRIFTQYTLPYVSITPTFSTCEEHGYISGEVDLCPKCNLPTTVWTRVTGYLRPVNNFHKGKAEEWKNRIKYRIK